MKCWLLLVLTFSSNVSNGQKEVLSKIPVSGKSISVFIPSGYDTLATAKGDLNKDGKTDLVLVLASAKEINETPDGGWQDSLPPRLLIVLFKDTDGFVVGAKSSEAILCKQCGGASGDPFADIRVEKGILILDHYGGSSWKWTFTHRFRFQQNDFYLIGRTTHRYWIEYCEALKEFAGTEYKDENLITGSYEKKSISEKCKLLVDKKGKQKTEPLQKLTEFKIEN